MVMTFEKSGLSFIQVSVAQWITRLVHNLRFRGSSPAAVITFLPLISHYKEIYYV